MSLLSLTSSCPSAWMDSTANLIFQMDGFFTLAGKLVFIVVHPMLNYGFKEFG